MADIAENTLTTQASIHLFEEFRRPEAVLAISNMVHDRFPMSSSKDSGYIYLGVRQASNMVTSGVWGDEIHAGLARLALNPERALDIRPALNLLGLTTDGEVQIARAPRARDQWRLKRGRLEREWDQNVAGHFEMVVDNLLMLLPTAKRKDKGYLEDLPSWAPLGVLENFAHHSEIDPLVLLEICLQSKLLYLRQVFLKGDKPVLPWDLSSGEQLVLSNVMRILGNVQPESLVLIDEPETGLHPAWQSRFIPLLESMIPQDYGCHFIMATHSPHIVVEGAQLVVPGEYQGEFETFQGEIEGRSVEEVLYQAFEARTPRNHQVERDLALIIRSIKSPSLRRNRVKEIRAARVRLEGIAGFDTPEVNSILAQVREIATGEQ
ncbi:hypothetical protein AC20117_08835 [Arthrobacter crystallopoietes]|nr:hypothetical protein AC20117_08835 [Arthrobacter crystallopoietes]